MPTYRYQAVDAGGRSVSGEISAADVRAAQQLLQQQGLRATRLVAVPDGGGAITATPPSSQAYPAAAGATVSAPSAPSTDGFWEYSRVAPKSMAVWLLQLRSMLKAGMTPANAMQMLSQRVPHRGLQQASLEIGRAAAQGVALSDAMARFPEVFPRFLVGAFRAAEHGGYLPEMIDRLVEYYEQHRVVRFWTRLTQGCLWHAVLLLPLIAPFGVGLIRAFRNFSGATRADALQAILKGVGEAFLYYGLPVMLILIALMLLGYLLGGNERLSARLRLSGLGFSTYADWIRSQSLDQYLFHLARLTQAGVYPATAHTLAAAAVPNRALAEALLRVSLARGDHVAHIDAALEQSGLFPIEEVMMARTGVQTGDVPNVLHTLAHWYRERAQANLQWLPRAFYRLMVFISILAAGVALVSIYAGFYGNLAQAVEDFVGAGE